MITKFPNTNLSVGIVIRRSGQKQIPKCFLANQIPVKKKGTGGFRIFPCVLQFEFSNLKTLVFALFPLCISSVRLKRASLPVHYGDRDRLKHPNTHWRPRVSCVHQHPRPRLHRRHQDPLRSRHTMTTTCFHLFVLPPHNRPTCRRRPWW